MNIERILWTATTALYAGIATVIARLCWLKYSNKIKALNKQYPLWLAAFGYIVTILYRFPISFTYQIPQTVEKKVYIERPVDWQIGSKYEDVVKQLGKPDGAKPYAYTLYTYWINLKNKKVTHITFESDINGNNFTVIGYQFDSNPDFPI